MHKILKTRTPNREYFFCTGIMSVEKKEKDFPEEGN